MARLNSLRGSGCLWPPMTIAQAVEVLDAIPAVDRRGAGLLVAELGIEDSFIAFWEWVYRFSGDRVNRSTQSSLSGAAGEVQLGPSAGGAAE
jgi:hypothetical protein